MNRVYIVVALDSNDKEVEELFCFLDIDKACECSSVLTNLSNDYTYCVRELILVD